MKLSMKIDVHSTTGHFIFILIFILILPNLIVCLNTFSNSMHSVDLNISNTCVLGQSTGNNTPPYFIEKIDDIILTEDFGLYQMELSEIAFDNEDPTEELKWYVTGVNRSLINITNENSTNQILKIRSVNNAYGLDFIKLWVQDSTGRNNFLDISIEIKPINDLPFLSKSNLPVILVNPNQTYTLNLQPYIIDHDNNLDDIKIKIANEDKKYAQINDFILSLDFKGPQYPQDLQKDFITLELTDGMEISNSTFEQLKINLTDNYPPERLMDLSDVILYKNERLHKIIDLDYYFTDPDHGTKQLKYESFNGNHISISIDSNNHVDIVPHKNWLGNEQIIFRCTDPEGAFNEQLINISISSEYSPLEFKSIPDLSIHYDNEYIFNLTPYINSGFFTKKLNFELFEFIDNQWIKNTEFNNIVLETFRCPILKINFSKNYLDTTIPVFISVSDGKLTKYQDFRIKVVNDFPPILKREFTPLEMDEDTIRTDIFDLYDYFYDRENSNLLFSNISNNIILKLKETGLVDVSIKPDWFGVEIVTIRAEDVSGGLVEASFKVKINSVNDPPVIDEIPVINVTKGLVNSFEFSKYVSDIDDNHSELQISVESQYVTVAGNFLIFDYPDDYLGEEKIILTVADGELSRSQNITIKVTESEEVTNNDSIALSAWMCGVIVLILVLLIIFLLVTTMLYINRLRHFKFTDIYLIYKDGLLIAHAAREKKVGYDSDIIGSMFTAIQDFIQESFSSQSTDSKKSTLKRLDFGDFQIVIDRGEYIYIAAIFKGFALRKMMVKITNLRKEIEVKYKDILPNWKGNMNKIKDTQKLLDELLYSTGPDHDMRTRPDVKTGGINDQEKANMNENVNKEDNIKDNIEEKEPEIEIEPINNTENEKNIDS